MPKCAKTKSIGMSISNLLSKRPAGETFFRRAGDRVFCTACNSTIVPRKSSLDQHLKAVQHEKNVNRHMRQSQLRDTVQTTDVGMALVEAFLAANIPLNKLSNPHLKSFLDDFLPCKIASISTMRSKYVGILYDKLLSAIKERLRGECEMEEL